MIQKMKKFTFLVTNKEYDGFINEIRNIGVLNKECVGCYCTKFKQQCVALLCVAHRQGKLGVACHIVYNK